MGGVENVLCSHSHFVTARLVGYNEELQTVATEAEAVPRLGSLLQSTSNERLKEVIETNHLLLSLQPLMSSPIEHPACAVCHCFITRGVSRASM